MQLTHFFLSSASNVSPRITGWRIAFTFYPSVLPVEVSTHSYVLDSPRACNELRLQSGLLVQKSSWL